MTRCPAEFAPPVGWLQVEAVAIETVSSRGDAHAIGKDTIGTAELVGALEALAYPLPVHRLSRGKVLKEMFGRSHVKSADARVRHFLFDLFGGEIRASKGAKCLRCKGKGWRGRGRPTCEECGGKGWEIPPGPMNGITGHAVQALGLAWAVLERERKG
jgi:hypothetical protein